MRVFVMSKTRLGIEESLETDYGDMFWHWSLADDTVCDNKSYLHNQKLSLPGEFQ